MLYKFSKTFAHTNFEIKINLLTEKQSHNIFWDPSKSALAFLGSDLEEKKCCNKMKLYFLEKPEDLKELKGHNIKFYSIETKNLPQNEKLHDIVSLLISLDFNSFYDEIFARSNFNSKWWLMSLEGHKEIKNHVIVNQILELEDNSTFSKLQEDYYVNFSKEISEKENYNPFCYHEKTNEDWQKIHFYENEILTYQITSEFHQMQIYKLIDKLALTHKEFSNEEIKEEKQKFLFNVKSLKEKFLETINPDEDYKLLTIWNHLIGLERIYLDLVIMENHQENYNFQLELENLWLRFYNTIKELNLDWKSVLAKYSWA